MQLVQINTNCHTKMSNKKTEIGSFDWQGKVILIVEDDLINYKFMQMTLLRTKANVLWAQNGKEAVEIFQKDNNIDIVLMDIQMPIMDGYEATRRIKEMDQGIPVIAQTAFAMNNEGLDVFEAGCDYYLKKPIKPDELLSVVSSFINQE